jgi:hypothetical protein
MTRSRRNGGFFGRAVCLWPSGRRPAKPLARRTRRQPVGVERLEARQVLTQFLDALFTPPTFTPSGVEVDALQFGTTAAGYAMRWSGPNGQVTPVTFGGVDASPSKPGAGWVAVAAQALEDQGPDGAWFDGYEVYWKQPQAEAYAVWVLDDMGARTSGRALTQTEVRAVESRINLDLNGDELVGFPQVPFTLVQTAGRDVDLGTTAAGYALRVGGESGQVIPVTLGGVNASPSNPGAGWMALGVSRTRPSYLPGLKPSYELLWKHAPSGSYAAWTLNEAGVRTGGRGLTLADVQVIEPQVNLDITGDSVIGFPVVPFTSLKTVTETELGTTSTGYALWVGKKSGEVKSGQVIPVTIRGTSASASNPGAGWVPVGGMPSFVSDGYTLLWKQPQANVYAVWTLSPAGAWTGGRGVTLAEVRAIESRVSTDLTGDSVVGFPEVPFTQLQTVGFSSERVDFGTTAAGYAIRVYPGGEFGSMQVIPITSGGVNASAANPGAGWVAVGAAQTGMLEYQLLWKHAPSGSYAQWTLNEAGARTGGRSLRLAEVQAIEAYTNIDITGDSQIGFPPASFTLIHNAFGLELGTTSAGYALRQGGESSQVIPLVWNGANASPTRPGASWQAVGAWQESSSSSFNGGGIMRAAYYVLWANEPSRAFSLWTVDESGAFVSGRPLTYSQAQGIAASLVSFDPPN